MRSIIALVASLALAGCATKWYKPGANEAEFNQAEYECQRASYGYGGVSGGAAVYRGVVVGSANPTQNGQIYMTCMRAHGWSTNQP